MSLAPYRLGIVLSATLAIFLSALSLIALFTPNLDYGVVMLILLAVVIGVPLCIALLVTWFVYDRRAPEGLPLKLHIAMFVPTLAAVSIIPIAGAMESTARAWFSDAHPSIREIHVNMSGRPLWLAVGATTTYSGGVLQMPLESGSKAKFVGFTRNPSREEISAGTFPYEGSRLRAGEHVYVYATSDEEGHPLSIRPRPLVQMPYPDLGRFSSNVRESELLVYQYFHYYDHVEVVPTLDLIEMSKLKGAARPPSHLVSFFLSNLYPPGLARLEVNGQAVVLGRDSNIASEASCYRPRGLAGDALVDIDKPLVIRWQTLGAPERWYEARGVVVPSFGHDAKGVIDASVPSVMLYFLGNDMVKAERFQELRLRGDRPALRATGLPAGVSADKACGSAADMFNRSVVTVLPN